jgi:syntaxin-binding protein 5
VRVPILSRSWLLANNLKVGGPNRPPSKRMIEQMRSDEQERRLASRQAPSSPPVTAHPGPSDEGYWAYMQRQVQERTANLGIMGDSIDKLEDNSSSWASDVNKFVNKQKKKAVMGGKFPFPLPVPSSFGRF